VGGAVGWWVSAVQSLDHTYRLTNSNPHWLHSFHLCHVLCYEMAAKLSLLLHYIPRFKGEMDLPLHQAAFAVVHSLLRISECFGPFVVAGRCTYLT
jgi:hypothetical protein